VIGATVVGAAGMLLPATALITRMLAGKAPAAVFSMDGGGGLRIAAVGMGEGGRRRRHEQRTAEENGTKDALHHRIPFVSRFPERRT